MNLSVVIPTYGRAKDLERLLESLSKQELKPDEIIIVIGPNDLPTKQIVDDCQIKVPSIVALSATKPSLVHSLNLGIAQAKGDVICLLDDDVWLPADWAKKINIAYKNDELLGAYGGRDRIQLDVDGLMDPAPAAIVGTFRWNGKLVGNHHCGCLTSPVEVDVLKGVNLSFRKKALGYQGIDSRLESKGAEICTEIEICQRVKLAGYKVVYDNENYLLHFVAQRVGADDRNDIFTETTKNRTFNQALVMAKFRPAYQLIFHLFRTLLIGTRKEPGIIRAFLLINKAGPRVLLLPFQNFKYSMRGAFLGLNKHDLNHK
ncbi:glycosyltransferase family 2 protein [Mucilaginibacter jinjuensis]|uniref:Glycosyltransferase family 2 protein n=1 Tax=Mucilaginibacter jinjuensis TaxID=1176721 RepID=A0ABY7TBE2_9SPHI|nr:glycosyltransferase family 2 protein [Mucilaginibacter jinjuensis]WCT13830.1 glycosyltransferase family 2 protein [Mucilaginibacter jinjuensis]